MSKRSFGTRFWRSYSPAKSNRSAFGGRVRSIEEVEALQTKIARVEAQEEAQINAEIDALFDADKQNLEATPS